MAFFGIDWAVFISLVLVSVLETMQCADLSRNLARSVARTLEAARGRLTPTVLAGRPRRDRPDRLLRSAGTLKSLISPSAIGDHVRDVSQPVIRSRAVARPGCGDTGDAGPEEGAPAQEHFRRQRAIAAYPV